MNKFNEVSWISLIVNLKQLRGKTYFIGRNCCEKKNWQSREFLFLFKVDLNTRELNECPEL